MNIILDNYTGKRVNKNVNEVSDSLKYPIKDSICERVHKNLKDNKDKKLIWKD